jgi:S1-C subfamily serine protease
MAAGELLRQLSEEFISIVEAAAPRVVQVGAHRGRPATGTIFRKDHVLVPAHAVDSEDGTRIAGKDSTSTVARYVGADSSANLAVLHVEGLETKALELAEARIGQLAVNLGRTGSGALVASAGIVSAIGGPLRTGRGRSVDQVLRADVRVHPLGAGGPLLDAGGKVIGIATGASMRGLPLFVPASLAWATGDAIVGHGGIERGYLGISAQPVRLPERQRGGLGQEVALLVVGVASGSSAERAGILVGDVLAAFDGQPIDDHEKLLSLLTRDRVGKPAAVEIVRGGEARTLEVTVGSRR